jgi:uncharacterized protein (TIGR03086 family)
MDFLNALEVATDEFGRRLAVVEEGAWTSATPCSDWDVHYLSAHVIGGNRFAVLILGGMSASDAIEEVMSAPQLGDDPFAAWSTTCAAQLDAFKAAPLERRVDHPLGEITCRDFLEFRVFDLTLHAWDLARAIGASERLDADLVDTVLGIVENGPAGMGFGVTPLGETDDTASPQARLLDLTRRR